jgi:hypothetical protein
MLTSIMTNRMKNRIKARYEIKELTTEEGANSLGVEIYDIEIDEVVATNLPNMDFAMGFAAALLHTEDTAREVIQPMAVDMAA